MAKTERDRPEVADLTRSDISFPPAWTWLMDDWLPTWVKSKYSPRESWKDKPFAREDVKFFFRGVEELSEMFTEERPKSMPAYFNHERFRSAYLLYFFPLQAAKFLALFELHAPALEAALAHGRKQGVLRVADFGAGPGTASIALLLQMLRLPPKALEGITRVEFDWWDAHGGILEDGRTIAEAVASHFPRLRGKVAVRLHTAPWWEYVRAPQEPTSLMFFGNVLNESVPPQAGRDTLWPRIWANAHGGGILFIEPANRKSAQTLAALREELLAAEELLPNSADASPFWGPCLHSGACPLREGRDWCHFSVPARVPGRWFAEFSHGLGGERTWVKFTYLWLAATSAPASRAPAHLRRVISDPIRTRGGDEEVLLCEPEEPGRLRIPRGKRWMRGSLISG